jgi:hypothetical protein
MPLVEALKDRFTVLSVTDGLLRRGNICGAIGRGGVRV